MKLGSRYKSGSVGTCGACQNEAVVNVCDRRQIKSIVKAGDKVLVVLDDCTYLEADFTVVDDSVRRQDTKDVMALKERIINDLSEKFEPVLSVGENVIFNAVNVNQ